MKEYVIDFICKHAMNLRTLDSCISSHELVAGWNPTKDEAIDFIKEHFSDIAKFMEVYNIDTFYNSFAAPQEFMVEIIRNYIRIILDEKFSVKNLKNILTN